MRELALHILDIAENSISANATEIKIIIEEDLVKDFLRIVIQDNGKGMNEETLTKIVDPFVTSRKTRNVGLGIPFFKAAAEACEGTFTIKSILGEGTTVEAVFKHSHIDRMPLGDITSTFITLLIGTPDVHWTFEYYFNEHPFIFDDQEIKQTLDGLPLSEPAVIRFIREMIESGLQEARHKGSVELVQ